VSQPSRLGAAVLRFFVLLDWSVLFFFLDGIEYIYFGLILNFRIYNFNVLKGGIRLFIFGFALNGLFIVMKVAYQVVLVYNEAG
jgi:hypothetical protein